TAGSMRLADLGLPLGATDLRPGGLQRDSRTGLMATSRTGKRNTQAAEGAVTRATTDENVGRVGQAAPSYRPRARGEGRDFGREGFACEKARASSPSESRRPGHVARPLIPSVAWRPGGTGPMALRPRLAAGSPFRG